MAFFREEARVRANEVEPGATGRRVLRGRIVTMDSGGNVIPDGYVCIQDDLIASVASVVPPEFEQAPLIQTSGTIYPGLIELHNHPSYNAIPLWDVPTHYTSRGQWRDDAAYKRAVANPAALLTHHPQDVYPKSVARFVECRALLGGATTTQGLAVSTLGNTASYYQGLVRNVEFSYGPTWPTATDHINDFASFTEFEQTYRPLMDQALCRLVIHLCEGTDDATRQLFANLIDPNGNPLVGGNLISIHATALGQQQLESLKAGGGVVWSPTSNFLLYGATTDVADAVTDGLAVAIGCDWAPSGTKNLLGELKIAKLTSPFSDEQLVRMVTTVPATMMGWNSFVGSVETGMQADLLVIGNVNGDPYAGLIAATESDVAAVLIAGKLRAGRASLVNPTTAGVELIHVANQSMVLDLVDDPSSPLAGVTLQSSIATLSDALEHLPDLARTFQTAVTALEGAPSRFRIHLEMDEALATDAVSASVVIGPGDVDPMSLDPITAVDDTAFVQHLKANVNLPQWLRDAI